MLVAHVQGDPQPVAIARLVRDGRSAEIAFAVADAYQQRGIGSALTGEPIADARAAGITHVTALVAGDNPAALALLRRAVEVLDTRFEGTELSIRARDRVAGDQPRTRFRTKKSAFAGRSPNRRMKYGYHSVPNGT